MFAFNTILLLFLAILPAPLAYIPKLYSPFTFIVPLFVIFPVSVVLYPAAIPILYRFDDGLEAPTVIVPLFVAFPPRIE